MLGKDWVMFRLSALPDACATLAPFNGFDDRGAGHDVVHFSLRARFGKRFHHLSGQIALQRRRCGSPLFCEFVRYFSKSSIKFA
jgi:hypothetical protein